MTLVIDTSNREKVLVFLEKDGVVIKKREWSVNRNQSEKLLSAIESLGMNKKDLKKIKVAHKGNSFTSLRVGVLTANALAYALNIGVEALEQDKGSVKNFKNFDIVIPDYTPKCD
jgi:tRNA A37 threonylcarbamoyladenosine modification protein TsaB